jgi:hypothetical protein
MVEFVVIVVTGQELVSHFPYSTRCRRNIPALVNEEIAALLDFLLHLELHPLFRDQQLRFTSWLVLPLALLQRKYELISVECGLHKNFSGPLKFKVSEIFF